MLGITGDGYDDDRGGDNDDDGNGEGDGFCTLWWYNGGDAVTMMDMMVILMTEVMGVLDGDYMMALVMTIMVMDEVVMEVTGDSDDGDDNGRNDSVNGGNDGGGGKDGGNGGGYSLPSLLQATVVGIMKNLLVGPLCR